PNVPSARMKKSTHCVASSVSSDARTVAGGAATCLVRLTAVADRLHDAAAKADDRRELPGTPLVQPLFDLLARHVGARERFGHRLQCLRVVHRRAIVVLEQRLTALV